MRGTDARADIPAPFTPTLRTIVVAKSDDGEYVCGLDFLGRPWELKYQNGSRFDGGKRTGQYVSGRYWAPLDSTVIPGETL